MFAEFNINGRIGKIVPLGNVTKISIATNVWNYTKKANDTYWNTITVFGKMRARVEKMQKGEEITVRGHLSEDSYDKDGQTFYVTNKVVSEIHRHTFKNEASETEQAEETA